MERGRGAGVTGQLRGGSGQEGGDKDGARDCGCILCHLLCLKVLHRSLGSMPMIELAHIQEDPWGFWGLTQSKGIDVAFH